MKKFLQILLSIFLFTGTVRGSELTEAEKRKQVALLFQHALQAYTNKNYVEAIDLAERIQKINLEGDTEYLREAKQIVERAQSLQKEEFAPFIVQAKEKIAEGDYEAARELCNEMLKRDPKYLPAKECTEKAEKKLKTKQPEPILKPRILLPPGDRANAK